jgi:DNA-binding CsgD family transcriptional regulator
VLDTTFSRLVGGIYDAVVDPALWTDAVDAIRREFGFHIAMMGVHKLPSGQMVVNVSTNFPASFVTNIVGYSREMLELWGGPSAMAAIAVEEPILHSPRLPPNWRKNRYYLEWCKPQGLVDQVVIALANDRTTIAHIGLGCHESRGPVEPETFDDLRLLAPHLRRAVNISRLLDMTTNAAATFEAALVATAGGAILVEEDMRIVYANPVARAMLDAADAIRSSGGRLELQTALVPEQLELAVRAAAGREIDMGRRGIGIPGRRRDGSPIVLHVLPLEQRSPRTGAPWKSVAAVFIADTGGQQAVPIDALSILFNLTPMESRVLEMTVAGHSSRDVADALAVAPSTIKTHMLNLFEKTGRHRREDLVKLASEVSLPN